MNNSLTDITIVLDRSGSMSTVRDDTIGGFNAFLQDQKTAPGEATLTLAQFDNEYEVVYNATQIRDVPPLTASTYVPGGGTALLDAIGRSIVAAGARLAALPEGKRPGKVILCIMTDGHENASREYSQKQVFDMISHQQDRYSWQVVFVGANQDAIKTAAAYAIPASNAMNYASTGVGTRKVMRSLSASTVSYRNAPQASVGGFFTDDQDANASPAGATGQ